MTHSVHGVITMPSHREDAIRDQLLIAPILQVYEYFVDVKKRAWAHWEEKLSASFRVNTEALPFYKIFVPTTDTVRYALPLTPNPTA